MIPDPQWLPSTGLATFAPQGKVSLSPILADLIGARDIPIPVETKESRQQLAGNDPRRVYPGLGEDYLAAAAADKVKDPYQEPGLLARSLFHTAASPFRAASGLTTAVKNLLGIPLEDESPESYARDNLAPATTTSGKVSDILLGGILPMVEQLAVGGAALRAGGLGSLAARSPLAARTIQEGASFGLLGLQHGREEGAVEGGAGAAIGAMKGLPGWGRILPALALGYGTREYYNQKHPEEVVGDLSQGDLVGPLNALFGILGKRLPLSASPLPDNFATIANGVIPPAEPAFANEAQRAIYEASRKELPLTADAFSEGGARRPVVRPESDIDLVTANRQLPGQAKPVFENPALPKASVPEPPPSELLTGEDRILAQMAERSDAIPLAGAGGYVPPQLQSLSREESKALTMAQRAKNLGKRSGGAVPELTAAIGRATTGAVLGGAVGAVAGPEDNKGFALGAAIGAGAFLAGPTILKSIADWRSTTPPPAPVGGTASVSKWDYNEAVAKAHMSKTRNVASLTDRALVRFDNWFASTRGENTNTAMSQSRNLAAYQLHNMEEAMKGGSFIMKPDANLKANTEKFLTGQMDQAGYLQSLQNAPDNAKAYANLMIEARKSMDGLMEQAALGQSSTKRAEMLRDTQNEYLRQTYKLYSEAKLPDPANVEALAQKIQAQNLWPGQSLDGIRDGLWQYANDVIATKGSYKPFLGTSKLATTIDESVFKHRKVLGDEMKKYLGEVTDPAERVQQTILKLKPMAEAGNYMSKVVNGMKDDRGLPMVFENQTALEAFRKTNPTAELFNYSYVKPDYRNGILGGKMVHREVKSVLDDWEKATRMDSGIGRFFMGFNRMMKSNVTYRNPGAIARQILGAPFFALIAKANPEHYGEALAGIKGSNKAFQRELIENGIMNSDAVTRDIMNADPAMKGLASLVGASQGWLGRADESILKATGMLRSLDKTAADMFRAPDNFVRVAAYTSAKYRIAKELGKALNDPQVIDAAVKYTNRYTMNYDLVAPIIKSGRNIPGISLFLTYTAEITRLMKNLGQDAILGGAGGRTHALLALGAVAALPEIAQQVSESNLSDKDKVDWQKVKDGLPVYSKNRYKIVTGREKNGSFNFIDFSSIVPTDNYAQMIKSLINGEVADAAKLNPVVGWDNSPVFNIVSQNIAGEDRYTKRKLKGPADRFATIAREVGGPFTPGGSYWRAGEQAFSTNAEGDSGITDKAGRKLSPSDFFTKVLSGLGSGQYNLEAIQRSQVAEAKSDIANELAYYNDIAKSDRPKEEKLAAAHRFEIAVQGIRENLERTLSNKN